MASIKEFIKWAEINSWEIKEKESNNINISKEVLERYKIIPYEYHEFLKDVEQCISASEKSWFICENEYNGNSDIDFKWNEFENLSLEAAEDDIEWKNQIEKWWDNYLPILMSVNDGYSFYAIDITNEKGTIVSGCEPEFEEVEKIADNFSEFLDLIINKKIEL